MRAVFTAIGKAVPAAVLTAITTFGVLKLYFWLFERSSAADIQHWQTFAAAMGSLGMSLAALLMFATYHLLRSK